MNESNFLRKQLLAPQQLILFRISVFATVVISSIIVLNMMAEQQLLLLYLPLITIAFIFSYFSRKFYRLALNGIKIVIAIGMLFNLAIFLSSFLNNRFGTIGAVAEFLIWLQLLHSFDLPAKRDLDYSLVASLMLVCCCPFFQAGTTFALYFLIYFFSLLFSVSISTAVTSILLTDGKSLKSVARNFKQSVAFLLLAILLTIPLIFISPNFNSYNISDNVDLSLYYVDLKSFLDRMPMDLIQKLSNNVYSRHHNKLTGQDDTMHFSRMLHLNSRGHLSNDLIMRVKTNYPSYYKGTVFSKYDGVAWKLDRMEAHEVRASSSGSIFLYDIKLPRKQLIVQVFNIVRPLDNVIYGENRILEIYFPGSTIYKGDDDMLLSPYNLEEGMIYSCTSLTEGIPYLQPLFPQDRQRYLQLPEISDRVKELARSFREKALKEHPNIDKDDLNREILKLIRDYLKTQYRYNQDVPPYPSGAEISDYLLFESKEGYCSHFATAFAVLCRLNKIPCRLVTGFVPSSYNYFTGYYEIRERDAHAWVEVYVNRQWYTYDPTPTYANGSYDLVVYLQNTSRLNHFLDSDIFKLILYIMGRVILGLILLLPIFYFYYLYESKKGSSKRGRPIFEFLRNIFIWFSRISRSELSRNQLSCRRKMLHLFKRFEKRFGKMEPTTTFTEYVKQNKFPEDVRQKLLSLIAIYDRIRFACDLDETVLKEFNSQLIGFYKSGLILKLRKK